MARIVVAHLLVAAAVLLPLPARAAGHWGLSRTPKGLRATADGRAETPEGEVPAVLRVSCKPGRRAPLCVSVKVEEAARIEAFDFAAFTDGGKARGQRLLEARAGDVAVEGAPSGSWAKEPPGAFSFDLCGSANGEGEVALLVRSIAAGVPGVEITLRHPEDASRSVRARFPGDVESPVVGQVLGGCARD